MTAFVRRRLHAFGRDRHTGGGRGGAGGAVARDADEEAFAGVGGGGRFDREREAFFGAFGTGEEQQFLAWFEFGFAHALRGFAVVRPEVPEGAAPEGVRLAENRFERVAEAEEFFTFDFP